MNGITRARLRVAALLSTVGLGLAATLSGCASLGADIVTSPRPGAAAYLAAKCPPVQVKPTGNALTYWSMWTESEPQGKVLRHALDCFSQQTGVAVNVQWQGRKLLTQNVAPALNTDTVPDLFDQDVNQIGSAIVAPGGTQGLDSVLALPVDDTTVGAVLPQRVYQIPSNRQPDGQIFLVPYSVNSTAWFYDRNVVGNISAPATTDQLFALFDAVKHNNIAAVAQDGDINFYNAYFFTQLAEQYVGPGGILAAAADRSGRAWTANPDFLAAAKVLERLAKGHYLIDGWNAGKFPQLQQQWADGNAGYMINGSWLPSEINEYLNKQGDPKSINYGSFPFPQPPGAKHRVVEQLPIGFALTKKAKNPGVAKAFIAYFMSKEILRGIPIVAGSLAARADVGVPPELTDVAATLADPRYEVTVNMDGIDGFAGGEFVDNVFYPLDNALLNGEISAEEFVTRMAEQTTSYWRSRP